MKGKSQLRDHGAQVLGTLMSIQRKNVCLESESMRNEFEVDLSSDKF